jgi:hypothetical protein
MDPGVGSNRHGRGSSSWGPVLPLRLSQVITHEAVRRGARKLRREAKPKRHALKAREICANTCDPLVNLHSEPAPPACSHKPAQNSGMA